MGEVIKSKTSLRMTVKKAAKDATKDRTDCAVTALSGLKKANPFFDPLHFAVKALWNPVG
jgi:hypothetical protein